MALIQQIRKAWTLRQVLGFFLFYMGLLSTAFTLDYGNQNLFSNNPAITGLYEAFVYLIVAVGFSVFMFVLLNTGYAIMDIARDYRKNRR